MALDTPLTLAKPVKGKPDYDVYLNENFQQIMDRDAEITSQIDDLTKKLIDPPVWQAPVYQNGWSSYVAHPLGYTKIRNVVYVLGLCVPPTNLASGQAIFTLPSGYWPKKSAYQVVAALNNAISQIFADASTGNVSIGITPGSMPSGWIPITLSFLTV